MPRTTLEHVNLTVSNPAATAAWLQDVFGWRVRWEGAAMNGLGHTYHVGDDDTYVALYSPASPKANPETNYDTVGGLNHVAVVTDDLEAVEERVKAAGFDAHSHANYEPGRRFYFHDGDGIEYEVVSYA